MSKLINYRDKFLIYINQDSGLSYKLLTNEALTPSEELIINSLNDHTNVFKLLTLSFYILIIKLNGCLDVLYDSIYVNMTTVNVFLNTGKTKPIKDIFSYLSSNDTDYIIFILFNDNSIKAIINSMNSKINRMYVSREKDDNENVLCVDITHDSIQILKLDASKIILTISGRTVIDDCPDPRLLTGSYI